MTEIILTSDQTQQLAAATDGVVIADAAGNIVVCIPPNLSEEEATIVTEAKRRLSSKEPRIPFSEVVSRVESLGDQ